MLLDKQNLEIRKKWDSIYQENESSNLEAPLLEEEISEEKFHDYLKEMGHFEKRNNTVILHQKTYNKEFEDYEYESLPKIYNKLIYLIWISFLVILEIPTNFTTIEQFLHKPLVSMLVTIAIGSLLVFIAHSHGSFFKQITFIINTPNSERNHNTISRVMRYSIALVGFIGIAIIFYGLYYARLQYFYTISGVTVDDPFSDGSGTDLVTATIFTKVGILMLANFAIYALGVIGSYIIHDTIPGYQEAYFKVEKLNKKLHKEYLKMKAELDRIAKKIRRKSKEKRNKKEEYAS